MQQATEQSREQKKDIRNWLDFYKHHVSPPFTRSEIVSTEQSARLYLINIYKIKQLQIPKNLDMVKTQINLNINATLFDKRANKFVSRTYQSPSYPILIDMEQIMLEKAKGAKFNLNPYLNDNEYFHEPLWVGFFGDVDLNIKDLFLAIDAFIYHIDQETQSLTRVENLGYCFVDIFRRDFKVQMYQGSSRDLLQNATEIQLVKAIGLLEVEIEISELDSDVMKRLIGRHVLFGQGDLVFGFLSSVISGDPHDIELSEFEENLDITISNFQITIHQALELSLLGECNELYPIQYKQLKPLPDQIKDFKVKQIQIVVHNGWKSVNSFDFDNSYQLKQLKKPDPTSQYNFYTLTTWRASLDYCFKNTIILFQIVYQADFLVDIIGRQTLTIYLGWGAVPVNSIFLNQGEATLSIDISGGSGHSFDRKGYFSKSITSSPGQIKAKFQMGENYDKMKLEHESRLSNIKAEAKRQDMQKQQGKKKMSKLKQEIIQESIQKKLDIKAGLIKDDRLIQQEKVMSEIYEKKEYSYKVLQEVYSMEQSTVKQTQELLDIFKNALFMGNQNLTIQEEKYDQKQQKLHNYQQRKLKYEEIQKQKIILKGQKFDQWIYDNSHPQINFHYNTDDFTDFMIVSKFGYHELNRARIALYEDRIPDSMIHEVFSNLQLYYNGELEQNSIGKLDQKMIQIDLEFVTFSPNLRIYTNSSKEEFSIPSFYSYENPIPTKLYFTVNALGSNEINTEKIDYLNGRSKQNFEDTLISNQPFFLKYEDTLNQAKISFTVEECCLLNQFAIIEVWNAENGVYLGKMIFPLFSIKQKTVQKKSKSPSRSISSPQSKSSYQEDDQEQIENIKMKKLPMPICKECDILSAYNEYIVGSVEICANITSAPYKVDGNNSEVKLNNKSKIISVSQVKGTGFESIDKTNLQKSNLVEEETTSIKQSQVQKKTRFEDSEIKKKSRFLSKEDKIDSLKKSLIKTDMLSLQGQKKKELEEFIQISQLKESKKSQIIKQIVDQETISQKTIIHRIGYYHFFPYTIINDEKQDCNYYIQIIDLNQKKKYGRLFLINDYDFWKKISIKNMIMFPEIHESEIYNKIIEKINENTNEIFYEFVLKAKTEISLIFFYDAIVPSTPIKDLSKASKDQIKVLVRTSLDNFNIIGGLNIDIYYQNPILSDVNRFWIRQGKQITIDTINPVQFYINIIFQLKRQYKRLQLFSSDLPDLELVYQDHNILAIRSESTLKEDQIVEAYIVVFEDDYEVLQIWKLIIQACSYIDCNLIQGKPKQVEVPFLDNQKDMLYLKSSRPRQIIISESLENGFKVVEGVLFKIPIKCVSYTEFPSCTKLVMATDKKVQKIILVYLKPQQPVISLLYDLNCQRGKKTEVNVLYQNKLDKTLVYVISQSHYQLKLLQDVIELNPFQKKPIKCCFLPEMFLNKLQIKVFLNDEISGRFDCIMFRVKYQ